MLAMSKEILRNGAGAGDADPTVNDALVNAKNAPELGFDGPPTEHDTLYDDKEYALEFEAAFNAVTDSWESAVVMTHEGQSCRQK